MQYVENGLILLESFILMEFTAWFAHKYIMHTIGWKLHRDHHQKDQSTVFEMNDFYFLIFAVPGILLISYGYKAGINDMRLWIGLGITLYGIAYVFVHDIFIHQRVKWFSRTDNVYFAAMRKAHKVHHKHLGKEDGECFGFLWVPPQYLIEAKKRKLGNRVYVSAD
jgi:beta-carotene 3-hydroxylase